ncbi:MAG: alginate export family protein [Bryobacterales bacterium]|nr:alginate export family protein [Bryobacterales bacterium]
MLNPFLRLSAVLALAAVTASAQTKPAAGGVNVSGSIRSRVEAWDWFQGDANNSYVYSGNLLRLSLSQSQRNLDWQVEFAAPILLGLPNDAIAAGTQGQLGLGGTYFAANGGNRNSAMVFPKQAFVRFKNLGGSEAQSLRVGRFEFLDGSEVTPKDATLAAVKRDRINQRLLGHFGWAHVGRSYDGAHYVWNTPKGNLTLVGAVPTRGVFQTDGWGWTNTAFGYGAFTKPWGKGKHAAETRVLALYYDDWRGIVKTDSRPLAVRRADLPALRIGTFGGHHLSAVNTSAGTVDAMLWGVGQTGTWGRLSHRAHAVAAEAGIQPKFGGRWKPWFRVGFFDGSGDGNPNDGTHNTFFQILPTPRPFARFPFFDLVNNRDWLAMMILRPHKQVTISSEFHALRLSSARDLWYLGGGVFQPWTFGYQGRAAGGARSLANLYDTSLEYRVNPKLTVTGYFGYAQGLAVTSAIYPRGKDAKLGYVELLYRFDGLKLR